MFHRIALFKVRADVGRARLDAAALAVADGLSRRGYDVNVGRPGDEASAKSWDLSVVARTTLRHAVESLDVPAALVEFGALEPVELEVTKTWLFEG